MMVICKYGVTHDVDQYAPFECSCNNTYGSDFDLFLWARTKYENVKCTYHITDAMRAEYLKEVTPKVMSWSKKTGDPYSRSLLRRQFTEKLMAGISKEELIAVKEETEKKFEKAIDTGRIGKKMLKELTMCMLRHKYNCPY